MNRLKADVVVIAGGASGLPAAITAAQGGAKVIVFEKGSTTGGTGNMGMGPFGVESRLQRLKQMGPTRDEAFKIFMESGSIRFPETRHSKYSWIIPTGVLTLSS